MSSCWGADSEFVAQLVAQREVGGGQSDQGSYQVSLGDPAAKQPADVQGELVEVRGGVGLEKHGELAGWGRLGGWCRGAVRDCDGRRRSAVGRGGRLQLVARVGGPADHGLSFLSVVSTRW